MRRILALVLCLSLVSSLKSQNLSYTCPRDTILACGNACFTLTATIPDIRSLATNYKVENITPQTQCYPLVDPGGPGPSTNLDVDDTYSSSIAIGFPFPFYGTTYNNLVVSTNGYVSFDVVEAGGGSHWQDNGDLPNTQYDRALIMGPYHDLDPGENTSPTMKTKYNVFGNAPNRKWILSFYKLPLFDCATLIENTHQIILHEGSGIIEVFIKDMQICTSWIDGKAMVGLQNMARNLGIMAPGRKMSDPAWGSIGMNETWRFIPRDGAPLYRGVQLLDGTGAVIATGDTTRINASKLGVSFPNICPPANVTSIYVVKTTYAKVTNPAETYYSLDTINVTRQNQLPITSTTTQTACGGSSGSLTATASGGTAPYQYSINLGTLQSSGTFTGLAAGTYEVVGIDAAGCTDTISVEITAIANIPGTATATPTGCPGVNNGTITVTPGGGTGPYTYSLDGGTPGTNNVITGVAAGAHTVIFTDVNGCSGTVSATVTAGSAITSTASTTGTSCAGASDGSIAITPTSGSGPYTYSINSGPFQSSNTFTGLASGNHSITIRDASGCTGIKTAFLNAGSGLNVTVVSTPETCSNANGTITVTTLNGTAPFTFTLDGGTPQSNNVFTGVASGIHSVVIRDANGCSKTQSIVVSSGPGISGTGASTATACAGVNNGTITLTATSGSSPFTYAIDGGTFQASNTFTGVSAGVHPVVIKDATGCTVAFNVTVAAGAAAITGTTATTPSACPGSDNGTIAVTATSGSSPYTYSINGTTFQASNTFSGLAQGAHTITIKDANGCTGTVNATVAGGAPITGTTTSTPTSCPGIDNGTITVTATSGTAPYTYSLDGTTFQASNILTGVSSGAQTVTIKDANGCTGTINTTVTAGTTITGTSTTVATSCPGVNNGSVTITATSGDAPYTYSSNGTTFQASNTFNGLAAGAHTFTIKDANGCTGTVSASIASGAGITGTATSTPTSCVGAANGSVTLTGVTGTAPHVYSLDAVTFVAGNVFSGLPAGNYTVTFRDANGCIGSSTVTVAPGPGFTATATAIATSCPGVNNGSITVTPPVTGGQAPFTYSLDGGASLANPLFSGLAAGPHTVIVTDALGCSDDVTVTIGQGSGLTGTASTISTSCPGVNNGSVTITVNNGTAPYQYALNGGTNQAGNQFSNLAAGAHTVNFTDALGCSGTLNFTIGTGAVITGTASSTATSCPEASNGTITVTAVTGTAPYRYSLDGGPLQISDQFINVASGVHTVTITDANGCTSNSVTVTVASGAPITATTIITGTTCPGVDNGEIEVNPATGTAPYLFSIDGGSTQASNLFTGLTPGLHTMTFTDANGCIGTITATVTTGSGLTGTAASTSTSCPGVDDGTITVTPTSGTAPYSFTLGTGTPQPTGSFTGLPPGSYSISFTDALGCTGSVSSTVGQGVPLTATVDVTQPVCAGIDDGVITVEPSSGNSPFQFTLNGGPSQASNMFTNLAAGVFNIEFTDAVGCTGTANATLLTNPEIVLSADFSDPLCFNSTDGSITIQASGGVSPYEYSIDGGSNYQSSNTFGNLGSGVHHFLIRDNVGCFKDISVTLTNPTVLTASATSTPSTCVGGDGTVTVEALGGTPNYMYSLDNATAYPFQTGNVFTVSKGTYNNVTVRDENGCLATTTSTVTEIDNMGVLFAGNDTTICQGQSVTFDPIVHPDANVFRWRENIALDNDTIKNATATPDDTTMYILTANIGVCQREDTIMVNVLWRPVPNAGPDQRICLNDSTTISGSVTHISGTVNYVWTPGGLVHDDSTATTIAVPDSTQWYVLSVTDNYGCNFNEIDSMLVIMQPAVPAFAGNDTIAALNMPHQLQGSGGDQYYWTTFSAGVHIQDPTVQYPTVTLLDNAQFQVKVTDIAGCIGYDTVYVQVYEGPQYFVPNAFTPNGDGLNDIFRAIPAGINTDYFRIFNRYGEVVFETNQYMKGWDGTFRGKKQPMGVYIWMLKGTDRKGRDVQLQGSVMLVQ